MPNLKFYSYVILSWFEDSPLIPYEYFPVRAKSEVIVWAIETYYFDGVQLIDDDTIVIYESNAWLFEGGVFVICIYNSTL